MVMSSSRQTVLWELDGSPSGTRAVATAASGDFTELVSDGKGNLYFAGVNASNQIDLWKFGPGGTATDLNSGIGPNTLTNVNGIIFFRDLQGDLWRTDGTPAGTIQLTSGFDVGRLYNVNGTLIFDGSDKAVIGPLEVWNSNGTPNGTLPIKDIPTSHTWFSGVSPLLYWLNQLSSMGVVGLSTDRAPARSVLSCF